jgi:cytochrome c-type biogenesis protein CcmH/NrfG
MSARVGVAVMAVLLGLYLVLAGQRAYLLLVSGEPVGVAMGAALLVLPVIAAWALWRELSFGRRAQALATRLEQEGGVPAEELDLRPSGRPLREQAEELFPAYRADVEAHPDDWRAWLRLSMAYDGAGDRTRARQAARRAIALESVERRG